MKKIMSLIGIMLFSTYTMASDCVATNGKVYQVDFDGRLFTLTDEQGNKDQDVLKTGETFHTGGEYFGKKYHYYWDVYTPHRVSLVIQNELGGADYNPFPYTHFLCQINP
jgi:hypothetical protein